MNDGKYAINLNRETFELLQRVKEAMTLDLGFIPTYGQVVRHLATTYFKG
jgi:hypothetical protein